MTGEALRIWRSWKSDFYGDETLEAEQVYTASELAGIREQGFNAIWIRGILRDLVGSRVFPELGGGKEKRLSSMRAVIKRAAAAGVKVMLYLQPPMGFHPEHPFWNAHPDVRGAFFDYPHHPAYALCTSTEAGKAHVRGMAEDVVAQLPGLGGLILITASEFQAHCYTHFSPRREARKAPEERRELDCPRCAARAPAEVVCEIINIFANAVREDAPSMRVMAWNWSWSFYEEDPAPAILGGLDQSVTLLVGFERGGRKEILGKERPIDEYSLGYAGPSERFMGTREAARERGMSVAAKLQIATTHELATVPNLPLVSSIYEKVRGMRSLGVHDFMGCWNFGNMPSVNTVALNRFLHTPRLKPRNAELRELASAYLPGCDDAAVVLVWEALWESMENHPFCIPFLYFAPVNYALGHAVEHGPLAYTDTGRSWMDDPRGDDLRPSFGAYSLDEIITGLGRLQEAWFVQAGVFDAAVGKCAALSAGEEARSIRVAAHSWRSAWNHYRAFRERRVLGQGGGEEVRRRAEQELCRIMGDEIANTRDALPIVEADPRMGYHIEAHAYLYDAAAMRRKIAAMEAAVGSVSQA